MVTGMDENSAGSEEHVKSYDETDHIVNPLKNDESIAL